MQKENYWSKQQPKSTGPTSEQGKAVSSRNAMKHGCCSTATLILKTENPADYHALEATWFAAYQPRDAAEKHLVQELINADWFYQRAARTLAEMEAGLLDEEPNPLHWTPQQQNTLARFLRYQTTRANHVTRCRRAVEDFRKARAAEANSDEKQVITRERHEIYKQKNQPKPSIQELIQKMMAEAPPTS